MSRKVLGLVLLICLAVGAASCNPIIEDGPEAVLADFVMLWEQGEFSAMYALLSSQAQAKWSEDLFVTRYRNITTGIKAKGIKLLQVSEQGANELKYVLEFLTATAGNFSQEYRAEFVLEEAGWRVNWDHGMIFSDLTEERVVRVSRQMPKRGSILDQNGLALATAGTVYTIGLVPGQINENTVPFLSALLYLPEAEISKQLNQGWVKSDSFVPVANISQQEWTQVQEAIETVRGVIARATSGRIYEIPHSLAQTIGYVGEVSSDRLKVLAEKGFAAGDIVGREGLELIADGILAGQPGYTITIRDGENNIVSTVASREMVNGSDLVTTIDLEKSRILDNALGDKTGSIILLDFQTGDVVALASKPGYDSNLFALGVSSASYSELLELDSPFLNRAFNGLYPPGSAFKPFTALMALEKDVCDPDFSWDTPRHWQKNSSWGGYQVTRVLRPLGPVNLWDAMKWSDNVYFADLGLKVGWEAFDKFGMELGFGSRIPFMMNNQQSQVRKDGRSEILLADSSYGQGEMLVTPLHLALMYASLARQDGVLPAPRLLDSDPREPWLNSGFGQGNLELIDRILAYTASDRDALAWVGSDTVRGKTGTSEVNQGKQVAWYVCYFDNYVLAVTLEGDKTLSSTHAAEVARICLNSGIR